MKLIFVTSDQFEFVWNKLFPASRIPANVPCPSIVLQHLDTVLLLGESVKVGSIESIPIPECASYVWMTDLLKSNRPFEEAKKETVSA